MYLYLKRTVALRLEEAGVLQETASEAKIPAELLNIKGIESALLTAAGLSDKAPGNLKENDKSEAITNLIMNLPEPAGEKFAEELMFRFLLMLLLTRGDAPGGSMRNTGGVLAQRKLSAAKTYPCHHFSSM